MLALRMPTASLMAWELIAFAPRRWISSCAASMIAVLVSFAAIRLRLSIASGSSLGNQSARAAEFFRKVLELRQTVLHPELRLLIVDVHAGLKRQIRNCCGENVDEPPARMLAVEMAAAGPAPFAVGSLGLVVRADVLRAFDNLERVRLPQREGVHRARRPAAARCAVAIAHAQRRARHREFDRAAEAGAPVGIFVRHLAALQRANLLEGRFAVKRPEK